MSDKTPILLWLRRDLRLSDHQALSAACATGRPVIPVFIHDGMVERLGAAPKFRLGLAVAHFAQRLEAMNSRLILRRGDALGVLRALIAETGAGDVYWSRLHDAAQRAHDAPIKAALRADGITARSFGGQLLLDPWTVETKTGGTYKVFTPFWQAIRGRDMGVPLAMPAQIPGPDHWPASDPIDAWAMGADMNRGAAVLRPHCAVGEAAARERLEQFLEERMARYATGRDFPAQSVTSRLSEPLTYGEISPRMIWDAGYGAMCDGAPGAEAFLRELAWREFAGHLGAVHDLETTPWRAEWSDFAWQPGQGPAFEAWCQARTGIPIIDAGLRELQVTGVMHNRVRMIVASYLCKHMLVDWRAGMQWFADQLIDWDPASNAMGWQWVAGCGPDAAPYFRVFNPVTQAKKFDADGRYVRTWVAEGQRTPPDTALAYFEATPRSWPGSPQAIYPNPIVPLDQGRQRALDAYAQFKDSK